MLPSFPKHGVDDGVDIADVDLAVTRYITIIRRDLAEHHVDNYIDIANINAAIAIKVSIQLRL